MLERGGGSTKQTFNNAKNGSKQQEKQLGLNTPGVQLNIVSATKPVVMCLLG